MPTNYYSLLEEIRGLLKGNLEKNQIRSIALFAAALESVLAGIESTVDIVEVVADYTGSSRNSCILADATAGDVNIYLPKAEDLINYPAGTTKLVYVKKADAGGNSVIIHADAVDTIEGSPTYTLTSPLQAVTLASDGNDWFIISTNATGGGGGGSGDVVGPASATDNAIARYNLTTGKLLQNSAVTITDLGSIALPVGQTVDGRDVSVDGAKLDTIETNADVTDATNVAAAGAVMESDYTPAHSLLVQQSGTGSPSSLSVGNNTILGREAGGGSPIAALSATSVKTILDYQGSEVEFTPDGDIAATDVQAAIVEVRDDTDTKLGTKVDLAGQLGGTISSPDVRGLRETSGPTLLTMGAVADGQVLSRSGASLVGVSMSGPDIEYISGFVADVGTAANRRGYTHGSDPLSATLNFTACVLLQPLASTFLSPGASIFGTFNGVAGGWDIHRLQAGLGFRYYDNGGVLRTSTFTAVLLTRKFLVAHLRVVNNGVGNSLTIQLFINGTQSAEVFNATAGGTYTAGSNLCLGPAAEGAVLPAAPVRVTGCGYITSALTADQIAAHAEACFEASDFVDPPAAPLLTNGWRVAGANPGTTWTSFKGGASLTALGGPTAMSIATKVSPILWG